MKDEFIRKAKVENVHGSDSITIKIDLGFSLSLSNQTFRLSRIDTPEVKGTKDRRVYKTERALGINIQQWLSDLLVGNTIFVKCLDYYDDNCILLCEAYIYIDDKVLHINQYMLDHGIAREYHGDDSKFPEKWSLNWYNEFGKDKFTDWKQSISPDINVIK